MNWRRRGWEWLLLAAAILLVTGSLVLAVKRHEFAARWTARRVFRELAERNPRWRFDAARSGMVRGERALVLRLKGEGLEHPEALSGCDFESVLVVGGAFESLDFLRGSESLRRLVVVGVKALRDASALAGRPLTQLTLTDCAVSDLRFLHELPQLESLTISRNPAVRDLSALTACRELTELKLSGCPGVSGLDALSGLSRLRDLDLEGTAVADLTPLCGLRLRTLNLADTPAAALPLPEGVTAEQVQR